MEDDDDDWLTFTPAAAKQELSAKNCKKINKSNIHKSPDPSERASVSAGTGNPSGRRSVANGTFGTFGSKRRRGETEEEDLDRMEDDGEDESTGTLRWQPPPRK